MSRTDNKMVYTEIVSDTVARKMLFFKSALKDGNKCRVYDGQFSYFVALEDEDLLEKINNGERFGKGDVLVVDLRQIQTLEGHVLKPESRIIKICEHYASLEEFLFNDVEGDL